MNITLHAPQFIYLALMLLGLGIALAKDGEPKTGNHNFWATFIGECLLCSLLYWGGFFG